MLEKITWSLEVEMGDILEAWQRDGRLSSVHRPRQGGMGLLQKVAQTTPNPARSVPNPKLPRLSPRYANDSTSRSGGFFPRDFVPRGPTCKHSEPFPPTGPPLAGPQLNRPAASTSRDASMPPGLACFNLRHCLTPQSRPSVTHVSTKTHPCRPVKRHI